MADLRTWPYGMSPLSQLQINTVWPPNWTDRRAVSGRVRAVAAQLGNLTNFASRS
jgi:hypothetical protein